MPGDDYEPNRVLGMPWRPNPQNRQQPREPQRVMGFPVDWFGHIDRDWLWSLAHPITSYRNWQRRRRLGPYAAEPPPPRRKPAPPNPTDPTLP
jgi:hypothetical protein